MSLPIIKNTVKEYIEFAQNEAEYFAEETYDG